MRNYFIIMIALASLLCGCKGYREIEVKDVNLERFRLVSASKINLDIDADVYNPTKAEFTVSDIQGVVYRDDVPFANIALLKEVAVPAFHNKGVLLKCQVELLDPMAVLVMGLNVKSWNMKEFRMKLKVTVKKGGMRKTFKVNDIPLDRLVKKIKL